MFLQVTITDVFNLNKCHTVTLLVYVSKTERDREFVDLMIYKSGPRISNNTLQWYSKDSVVHQCQHIIVPFSPVSVVIQLY